MHKKSRRAIYELRDFLDHLSLVLDSGTGQDGADVRHHYEECCTHLRRAAVEPLEYMAETQLKRVLRLRKCLGWIPYYPPSEDPFREPDFFDRVNEIRELIADVRTHKPEQDSVERAKKALAKANGLRESIPVGQNVVRCLYGVLLLVGGYCLARFFPGCRLIR